LESDPGATDLLMAAAQHPRAFDHAFEEPFVAPAYRLMIPAQFQASPSEVLIRTVCQRVTDFRRLYPAAIAALDLRGAGRQTPKFGPYLPVAFPDGLPTDRAATPHQQAFASAIVRLDGLVGIYLEDSWVLDVRQSHDENLPHTDSQQDDHVSLPPRRG
jgi:hypothetical protein